MSVWRPKQVTCDIEGKNVANYCRLPSPVAKAEDSQQKSFPLHCDTRLEQTGENIKPTYNLK